MNRVLGGLRSHVLIPILLLEVAFLVSGCQGALNREEFTPSSSAEVGGEIDSQIFLASVPHVMTLGAPHRLKVVVRNVGDISANYAVVIVASYNHFYVDDWFVKTSLEPGGVRSIEFPMVAILPHTGPLEIAARLYSETQHSELIEIDSVSDHVLEIRRIFPVEWILALTIIISVALLFVKLRPRTEAFALLILFSISMLLRVLTLPNLVVLSDEITVQFWASKILAQGWRWPKPIMWEHPPLESYLVATTTVFLGNQLEILRWTSAIAGALTVCALYMLGKALFDRRVGLLSALLLAFSGYHIYWGTLLRPEALAILFNVLSSYFFWLAYSRPRKRRNMFIAGAIAGLSFDTFYLGICLPLAFVAAILWFRPRWKSVSKRDLLVFLSAWLLATAPVLASLYVAGVNPFWYSLFGRFERREAATAPGVPPLDLALKGLIQYVGILTWRAEALWWFPILGAASLITFLAACAYHGYSLLRRRPREGFPAILFGLFALFVVLYGKKVQYFLMYSLPFSIILISNLAVLAADRLRPKSLEGRRIGGSDLVKVILLALVGISVFSSACIGVMMPAVERGEVVGLPQAMSYLKRHGQPGDLVATPFGVWEQRYAEQLGIDVDVIPLLTLEVIPEPGEPVLTPWIVNVNLLRVLQPRFIVITRFEYDFYFGLSMKEELSEDYGLVLDTGEEIFGGVLWPGRLVFKKMG